MSMPSAAPLPNFDEAPWKEFPALTKEALEIVAESLREARVKAVLRYQPDEGELPWNLGSNAYSRQMKAIKDLPAVYPWCGILREISSLAFSFSIGPHAVRFYRSDTEEAPSRYLRRSYGEVEHAQYLLEFAEQVAPENVMFRIAIATDEDGYAADIHLVKMRDDGEILGRYLIPKKSSTNVIPLQTKPVDLPPVTAIPKEEARDEKKEKSSDDLGDETKNVG